MSFQGFLKQATAIDVIIGPFVDSTDGDAEEISLTINQADVRLSKNGQTAAQKSDVTAAAHDADGFYNCEFDATDTGTVGQLVLWVHVAGALAVTHSWHVIEEVIYDALYGASAAAFDASQRVDLGSWLGTAPLALLSQRVRTAVGAMDANVMTASALATDAREEISDQVWDEDIVAAHGTADTAGLLARALGALISQRTNNANLDALLGVGDVASRDIPEQVWAEAVRILTANTNFNDPTVGAIADQVWEEAKADHVGVTTFGDLATDLDLVLADTGELQTDWTDAGRLDALLDAIKAVTDLLPNAGALSDLAEILTDTGVIGAAGAGLSAIPWNAAWDVEVESEVNDALVLLNLDHLLAAAATGVHVVDDSVIAQMVSLAATADWDTFDNTTDALEALRERGDAAWTTGAGGTPPTVLQNTTILVYTSQTSFTLTAGSADNDAYNGMLCIIEDQTTGVQKAVGVISDYIGASRTVTLREDPLAAFTFANGDIIDVVAISPDVLDILADTDELQTDWTDAGRLDALIDAIKAVTDLLPNAGALSDLASILTDTGEIGSAGAGLSAIPWNAAWDTEVESEVNDALVLLNLDHLLAVAATGANVVDDSVIAQMVAKAALADWDTFDNETESLEALRDRGDAAWTTGAGGSPPTTLQNTTIAVYTSQTSFTLTAGSVDDDAYNGMLCIIEDQATATQKAVGVISNYDGGTKAVTLREDPLTGFTFANGDTIDIVAISPDVLAILADTADIQPKIGAPVADVSADLAAVKAETALIVADTSELQTDDVPGLIAALNDPTAATVAAAVWDALLASHVGAGSFGLAMADLATILADTNELQSDDVPGLIAALNDPTLVAIADAVWDEPKAGHVSVTTFGDLATDLDSVLADTNELQVDDVPGLIAALNDPTVAAIVNGVWDELLSGHVTAGTFGLAMADLATILVDTGDMQPKIGAPAVDLAADIAALNDLSTADVNAQVVDVLKTDTIADIAQGIPPATPTFEEAVMYLYSALRNRADADASEKIFFNNADVAIWKKALSDAAGVYSEAEGASGP